MGWLLRPSAAEKNHDAMTDIRTALLDIASAVRDLRRSREPSKAHYDAILSQILSILLEYHEQYAEKPIASPPPLIADEKPIAPKPPTPTPTRRAEKRLRLDEPTDSEGFAPGCDVPERDMERLHPAIVRHIIGYCVRNHMLSATEAATYGDRYTAGAADLQESHLLDGEGPSNLRNDFRKMSFHEVTIMHLLQYRLNVRAKIPPKPKPLFAQPTPLPGTQTHM